MKISNLNISIRLMDHLIQGFLIFFSVLLAFWLTEARDKKLKKESLETSLSQIASELSYNHQQIEKAFDYHRHKLLQMDSIRNSLGKDFDKATIHLLSDWRGIQMPILRSTAYSTFLNTDISTYASIELSKALADIYNMQLVLEKLNNSLFDKAILNNTVKSLPSMMHVSSLYYEMLPEVILNYQILGYEYLKEYGYDLVIASEELKKEVRKYMN